VSNYRFFDQAVVDRLNQIISLREEGHTLNQIKALLEDRGDELLRTSGVKERTLFHDS
jgi:DNA-binding transcriptional MerR regulator